MHEKGKSTRMIYSKQSIFHSNKGILVKLEREKKRATKRTNKLLQASKRKREREKNGSYEVARKKRACENCEHYIRNAIASPI